MNRAQAIGLIETVLTQNGQTGIGLNQHGQGALDMGPVKVFLQHDERGFLHLIAPAYIWRGTPDKKRVDDVLAAFTGTELSFLEGHNAFCYCRQTDVVDPDALAASLTDLAQKASKFDHDLSAFRS